MSELEIRSLPVEGCRRYVYRVFDGNRPVSGICGNYLLADVRRDNIEAERNAALRTERPCMSCRRLFQSEGSHNRLCNDCGKASLDNWMI